MLFSERASTPPRKRIVTFPLDDAEFWTLKEAAMRSGRSVSAFIRQALGQAISREAKDAVR